MGPPALPPVNTVFTDFCYETPLMRLTDESDGLDSGTNYSYWPSFNCDSSRLLILSKVQVQTWTEPRYILCDWDACSFHVKSRATLGPVETQHCDLTNGVWSAIDPNLIYSFDGPQLNAFNVAKQAKTVLKDFSTMLPGEIGWQMHRSLDDNVFSFTRRLFDNDRNPVLGYAVWQRNADVLLVKVDAPKLDEVQLDKTGRYLIVKTPFACLTPGDIEGQVLDLVTGKCTGWTDGAPGYNFGHSDNGAGIQVGENNWEAGVWIRDLRHPAVLPKCLLPYGSGGHYSMLGEGDSDVLVSQFINYTADPPLLPMDGEIYLLGALGSQRVRHICRHESYFRDYQDTPRANISRCKRFVAFTSNWGGRPRRDFFVAWIR